MEKLGLRIKRLRKEKGVKQSFLYDNQSAISQIERGFNDNPGAELLREVAKNLDITFDELVKGTNWSSQKESNSEGKYGYSELDFDLSLNESGKINVEHKRYLKHDSNGLENRFCPRTSTPLVFNCKYCQKPIQSNQQIYCMGCGKKIFQKQIYETMDECLSDMGVDNFFLEKKKIMHNTHPDAEPADNIDFLYIKHGTDKDIAPKKFFEIRSDKTWLKEVIDSIESCAHIESIYGGRSPKNIIGMSKIHGIEVATDNIKKFFERDRKDESIKPPEFVDFNEYIKGLESKNDQYYNFHLSFYYRKRFYELLAFEISRLTLEDDNVITYNDELPL